MWFFVKRLKELREKESLTQKQLSNKLGLSSNRINAYECRGISPSIEVVQKIVNFFRVSICYLYGMPEGRCFDVNIKSEYLKIVNKFLSSKDEQKIDNICKCMEFILHQ